MRFDIRTVSEANTPEHWSKRRLRKVRQQSDFVYTWRQYKAVVTPPATITFTRYSLKTMDTDNLAGAFKHVRDALAREIGIDDGDTRVTWKYGQETIHKREHYFTIKIS